MNSIKTAYQQMRKPFGVALILLIVFNLLLSGSGISRFRLSDPNQWLANEIRAQSYTLRRKAPLLVMTGSSLTQRVPGLHPRSYNLAFAGTSSMTGLEIVRRTRAKPKFVLVELNTLETPVQEDLLRRTFHPVFRPLRRALRSQRAENQPANFLLFPMVYSMMYVTGQLPTKAEIRHQQELVRGATAPKATVDGGKKALQDQKSDDAKSATKTGKEEVHRGAWQENEVPPVNDEHVEYDLTTLESVMARLKRLDEDFKRHGTTTIYFEMPVHENFRRSKGYRLKMALARERLKGRIVLPPFDVSKYGYSDGQHLAQRSALPFGVDLFQALRPLLVEGER